MQIRQSAKKLICIRNIYQKHTGKGKASTVASFPRYISTEDIKTHEAFDLLTIDEQQQIIDYLRVEEEDQVDWNNQRAARMLTEALDDAISASKAGVAVSEERATKLYARIDEYQKLLKKQGFKKGELLKKEGFQLEQEQDGVLNLNDFLAKVTDSNKHAPV
jgi:hypothetical protein